MLEALEISTATSSVGAVHSREWRGDTRVYGTGFHRSDGACSRYLIPFPRTPGNTTPTGSTRSQRPSCLGASDFIPTEINRSLNPSSDPKPASLSRLIHQTCEAPTKMGTADIRRVPLAPNSKRTDPSGGGSVARRCALGGDLSGDEQWSDGLSNQSSHKITCPKIIIMGKHEPDSQRGWARIYPRSRDSIE